MKINGSLVFDSSAASEIQNLRVEKYTNATFALTYTPADAGRLVYHTNTSTLYFGSAAADAFVSIATGGSAASAAEVDAMQTTLGVAMNSDGTLNAAGFVLPNGYTATSFTDAINKLAEYATGHDNLSELADVTLTSPAAGQFLKYDGTKWVNASIVLADVSDVTATAAELNVLAGTGLTAADVEKLHAITASAAEINILDGATVTTTELNYVSGVTSPIQAQIDGKQAADATLDGLAALTGTGIVVETAADTFTTRKMVAPAAGFTITNDDGVAGDFTFALANDLAALEGLTTTGFVVRTGDGTAATRSVTGTTDRIVVTDGNGVASDVNVDLATVTDSGTGSFKKVTVDGYGRVTGTEAVVAADITALVDATYVNASGDSMSGNLDMGGNRVTSLGAPVNAGDAATKNYVDSVAGGLTWQAPVAKVGATNDSTGLTAGDRFLNTADSKVYTFDGTAFDAGVSPVDGWSLFDRTDETGYVFSGTSWVQFTGTGQITAGVGMSKTGNVLDINLGAGIGELPSDEVGIDLYSASAGAIVLTEDGTTRSTASAAKLHLMLKSAGGLTQDADGLYIGAAQVANSMLANSGFSLNGDAGTGALALGETIKIAGDSAKGISTEVLVDNSFKVTAADASDVQKGVATFNVASFAVTAGDVTIKAAGVTNAQLVNSVMTLAADEGTADDVALGETMTFSGGDTHTDVAHVVKTTVGANSVTFAVREATNSLAGVASFDGAHFSVTAGAVSLAASMADLTNVDAAVDTAATDDLLTYDGAKWNVASRASVIGSVSIDALNDVTLTNPVQGEILVRNGSGQFVNKPFFYTHDQSTAATTWTVTHNLGQKYANVTIVDDTDEVVLPQSVTFNTANQLTVTFNSAVAGKVIVTGLAI